MAALYDFHADKAHFLGLPFDDYVSEKVAIKARQFNTILNNPELEAERQALELKKAANACLPTFQRHFRQDWRPSRWGRSTLSPGLRSCFCLYILVFFLSSATLDSMARESARFV